MHASYIVCLYPKVHILVYTILSELKGEHNIFVALNITLFHFLYRYLASVLGGNSLLDSRIKLTVATSSESLGARSRSFSSSSDTLTRLKINLKNCKNLNCVIGMVSERINCIQWVVINDHEEFLRRPCVRNSLHNSMNIF